ncbi:hypothetical protein L2E82_33692 [Cichorium intybus]|uniref:Uncharacterized protein n=1 Tax=Cichorium intybus TaxID=13427 RepID=A0ACB9BKW5_CICIN|nr:hypothetical protein L2E82_33692 [Cichorium intybus]
METKLSNRVLQRANSIVAAVKLARKIPVINMWTTDDLENREMEEIISGGFGLGKVEYEEKFERLFEIVLDGKKSMQEIVSDCMAKFPNENRTKEFIKRMKELFTEDDNQYDFGVELDRDANVLEAGVSGDVGNQDNLNEGGDDDRNDVHDVKGKKILSKLDKERGVQNKYDSFDGGSKLSDEKKLLIQFLLRCSEDDDRMQTEDTLNVSTPSKRLTPRRVLVHWQETHATLDNGVFLMRHMETYVGQEDNNWTDGLGKQESKRDKRLFNLRILYIVRLAMHEININRRKLQEQVSEFGKIDFATRDSLMNKGMYARNIKEGLCR